MFYITETNQIRAKCAVVRYGKACFRETKTYYEEPNYRLTRHTYHAPIHLHYEAKYTF